jgi:hypothetical protein
MDNIVTIGYVKMNFIFENFSFIKLLKMLLTTVPTIYFYLQKLSANSLSVNSIETKS